MFFRQCFLILLSLTLVLFSPSIADAQTVGEKLDINSLTQEQLQGLLNKAQQAGYTLENIDQYARARGLSASEITVLRTRLSQLNGPQNATTTTPVQDLSSRTLDQPPVLPAQTAPVTTVQSTVFGTNIFSNPNLTFTPNLNVPTPQNYVLGPGDQVNIELWGKTELSVSLTVSPDGYIRPNNLGPIYVNGLTIERAQGLINRQLDRIYDGLIPDEGQTASVFSLITLGQIRSIGVTVVGEVTAPGNYNLNSLSTVYTALYASGGPNPTGTFREIQLIRNNKLFKTIDVYDFLIRGIKEGDVMLKHDDIILVKPYESRITVNGEVKRSGQFEIKGEETLNRILEYAGGFTQNADRAVISLERSTLNGTELMDLSADQIDSFQLQDGDVITVRGKINRFVNRVVIEGAVINSGQYELTDNMNLQSLIAKAGGLRGDAYQDKVLIYRIKDNFEQEVFSYSLQDVMSGQVNVVLQSEDIVEIKSIFSLSEEPYVRITGQIANSGVYPYLENLTPYELIMLAGGMRADANTKIEISRIKEGANNNFENEIIQVNIATPSSESFSLQPFDRVYVRSKPGYLLNREVRVGGEINSPGLFSISQNSERISDIIKRAGGLTEYAYAKGALLIRKNELTGSSSGFVLDREAINTLRQKIFDNVRLSRNSRSQLTERIEQLATENYEGLNASEVTNVRKDLLALASQANDSTNNVQVLSNYEPVTIDLQKILDNPGSEGDLFLRAGDIISIPPQLQTVRVSGEVISNVNLKFESNKAFKKYIDESGGYIRTASRGRSFVQYPNGERAKVRRFLFFKSYPKIEPGSTIVIARKRERAPINFGTIVSSTGSLLSLALVIDRLSN